MKKSNIYGLLAMGLLFGNLAVEYRNSSASSKISKMSYPTYTVIERPAVLGELEKAMDEKTTLQNKYDESLRASESSYNSTNFAAYLSEANSNQISRLQKGISIIDADIAKMRDDPAIPAYNSACDNSYRVYEEKLTRLIDTKQQLEKPYNLSSLFSMLSVVALMSGLTFSLNKKLVEKK